LGLEDEKTGVLPPHPHPITYRHFLYASAEWLEDMEYEKLKAIVESNGASLQKQF
jgi:hypothetical protein